MITRFLNIILIYLLIVHNAFADSAQKQETNNSKQETSNITAAPANTNTQVDYQKIIQEYKEYLATVKPEIQDEIRNFRLKIAEFNKQKRDLYKQLSQEAQNYLAQEQKFKSKLPLIERKNISKIISNNNNKGPELNNAANKKPETK